MTMSHHDNYTIIIRLSDNCLFKFCALQGSTVAQIIGKITVYRPAEFLRQLLSSREQHIRKLLFRHQTCNEKPAFHLAHLQTFAGSENPQSDFVH